VIIAVVADTTNIAGLATVTASTQNTTEGQGAEKAVDGFTDGQGSPPPGGDPTHEWATTGGKAGSWLQLEWSSPQAIDHVVLYDRPNQDDHGRDAQLPPQWGHCRGS
jgi:hypothetical protein